MGNCNTGDRNTGDRNTGDCNTGDWNTGDCNTGYCNTGYCNTGDRNTGDCNTGDWNTGDWNTGDRNTGYCNTELPKIRIFNKETDVALEDIPFPNFFYFSLTEWVSENNMTDEEKESNSNYTILGGYLKTFEYKEAWQRSWNKASEEDKKKLFELPNFDAEIFLEITGIKVNNKNDDDISLSKKIDELQNQIDDLKRLIKRNENE